MEFYGQLSNYQRLKKYHIYQQHEAWSSSNTDKNSISGFHSGTAGDSVIPRCDALASHERYATFLSPPDVAASHPTRPERCKQYLLSCERHEQHKKRGSFNVQAGGVRYGKTVCTVLDMPAHTCSQEDRRTDSLSGIWQRLLDTSLHQAALFPELPHFFSRIKHAFSMFGSQNVKKAFSMGSFKGFDCTTHAKALWTQNSRLYNHIPNYHKGHLLLYRKSLDQTFLITYCSWFCASWLQEIHKWCRVPCVSKVK